MKKITILILFMIMAVSFVLTADELDSYLNKVQESSTAVRTSQIAYDNAMLSLQKEETKPTTQISVNSGNFTYGKNITSNTVLSFNPSVDFTFPETDGGLQSSVGIKNDTDYLNNAFSSSSITPYGSLSKKFEFESFDDTRTDNSNTITTLSVQKSLDTVKLNVNIQVLETLKSIISIQQQIDDANYNLQQLEKAVNNQLELENITKDSLNYKNYSIQIDNQKNSIEVLEWQLDTAKENFKINFGIEPVVPSIEREPDLTLIELENGNTDVVIAALNLENAKKNIESLTSKDKTIMNLTGNVDLPIVFGPTGYERINTEVTGGISIGNGKSFAVNGSTRLAWGANGFDPSFTISGSWNNNTTTESEEIDIKTAENNQIDVQIKYNNSLVDYKNNVRSIQQQIDSWVLNNKIQENNKTFHKKQLEQQQQLFDLGLTTKDEVEKVQRSILTDETNDLLSYIDGRILEYKIGLIQL